MVRRRSSNGAAGDRLGAFSYPFADERELRRRILAGDQSGAIRALTSMVGVLVARDSVAGRPGFSRLRSDALHLAVVLVRKTYEVGVPVDGLLDTLIDIGRQIADARTPGGVRTTLEQLVTALVRDVNAARREGGGREAVERALAYVQAHFKKDLSLREVAGIANLSSWYLSRSFPRVAGVPFHEYVTELRVAAAKEFLAGTRLTVEEVARQVGYEDPGHFSRTFKRRTGMTPRAFARPYRENGTPPRTARMKPAG